MFFQSYLFKHGKTIILFCICLYLLGHHLNLNKLKILAVVLFLFSFFFFRIPRFSVDPSKEIIRATAFGKVGEITVKSINGVSYVHIPIKIGLFDQHVQYAPCTGNLKKMIYKKGEFNPALILHKSNNNERMMYYQDTMRGQVIFSQIAGMIARTIVSFVKEGDNLTQGQEIGMIKFGSRSDIFIPYSKDLMIAVQEGDQVKGGQTILGYYNKGYYGG